MLAKWVRAKANTSPINPSEWRVFLREDTRYTTAMSTEFEKRYKSLNTEQRSAVDTTEGPVMVVAGPGTGKTTILTLRIANILRTTDTPPHAILAITYTDAGVRAIRKKLTEIIGDRAAEVAIHTFHSFSHSVLTEFKDHVPHVSESEQMNDTEIEHMIHSILDKKKYAILRPLGRPDLYVNDIIRGISSLKKDAISPDDLRTFARRGIEMVSTSEDSISTRGKSKGSLKAEAKKQIQKYEKTLLLADMYQEYEERKREESRIDYDDLILELLAVFSQDELLLQLLQEKFLYVHIDEHQDTNDSQNLILQSIISFFTTPNIFIVGDEKQAIYRFQGASVKNFLHFSEKYPTIQTIPLTHNYRSNQRILDASHAVIMHNYTEANSATLLIPLTGSKTEAPTQPLTVITGGTEGDTLSALVEDITLKPDQETVAVIVRKNAEVDSLLSFLQARGVSASAERGVDILSHPLTLLFFALLRVAVDSSDTEALAITVSHGLWNLSFADSVVALSLIKKGDTESVVQMIPQLKLITKEKTKEGVISFLIYLAEVSTFLAKVTAHPLSSEVWRNILTLSEHIATAKKTRDPHTVVSHLLSYQGGKRVKKIFYTVGAESARVFVMTAHGSKGLEYDHVYIPYATEESWIRTKTHAEFFILPSTGFDSHHLQDERRLFYVALTRARKTVTFGCMERMNDGRTVSPLRFISDIPNELVVNKTAPYTTAYTLHTTHGNYEYAEKEIRDYTEQVLRSKGISVTALNHFMDCPRKFYYQSILKIPHPPNPSSEKGNAMHHAISAVWNTKKFSERAILETLDSSILQFLKKSDLRKSDSEVLYDELAEIIPALSKSLVGHFNQSGVVKSESWVESAFVHKGESFKLHGKMDTIIETESEIQVYDYKTKKAMSDNEILGLTKGSDGAYWRQLIFYSRLLADTSSRIKKKVTPYLMFIIPNERGDCKTYTHEITNDDISRVEGELTKLIDSVQDGTFLTMSCNKKECEWCALSSKNDQKD